MNSPARPIDRIAATAVPDAMPVALELISDMAVLPDSFIVHAATNDHNAPLICRGDIVVVNAGGAAVSGGWYPMDGGLFLIEHTSRPTAEERYARRARDIVQTFTDQQGRWWAGGLRRGLHRGRLVCSDGPYANEDALADKLIGRVVGLYRPTGAVQ